MSKVRRPGHQDGHSAAMFAQPCATANGRSDDWLGSMIGGHGEKQLKPVGRSALVRTLIYLRLMGNPFTTVGVYTICGFPPLEIRGEAAEGMRTEQPVPWCTR